MSNADELKNLKELFDSGVLSKEEFEIEKSKIIFTKDSSSKYKGNLGKKVRNSKKSIVYASIALVVIMIGVFYLVITNNKISANDKILNEQCESFIEETNIILSDSLNTLDKYLKLLFNLENAGLLNWESLYKESQQPIKVLGFYYENLQDLSPTPTYEESYQLILIAFSDIIDGLKAASRSVETEDRGRLQFGLRLVDTSRTDLKNIIDLINQNKC